MSSEASGRRGRDAIRIALWLALIASAWLALAEAHEILAGPAVWNDQPVEWAKVALTATVAAVIPVLWFPRHAAAAATCFGALAAAALVGPGAAACVALMLTSAWVMGSALLSRAAPERVPWPIIMLAGVALGIGAFAATRSLGIHHAPVHTGLALAVVTIGHRRFHALGASLRRWITTPCDATLTERGWIVVATVVLLLHAVVVAKPEVGYDASAMHLQFAELVFADQRFRYGVDRFLWATMPLGADYAFATAFLMGGQSAARAINLSFGVTAAVLVYRLARPSASREHALAGATLFASMPIAMLVTGSLFSETLWVSFLLAATLVVRDGPHDDPRSSIPMLAMLAGGAMATKVISLLWLAPLLAAAMLLARTSRRTLPGRYGWWIAGLGLSIGAWPYVAAWLATGNPVFPFMNAFFQSPLIDSTTSFNNPAYNARLVAWTPWQLVTESARFIEGRDGAIGLAWLFVYPLVLAYFAHRRDWADRLLLAVIAVFAIAVFLQQSYLRYLLPGFAALIGIAAAATSAFATTPRARALVLVAGILLVAFDIRNISAGHYSNATPCARCLSDPGAREDHVATYAPLRVVASRLNRELPDARVGFMLPNEPAPSGYVGMSRSGNWHDSAFFRGLVDARSADELLELARRYELTHVVVRATDDSTVPALGEFRRRHTTPRWSVGDYVVASVR